MVLRNEYILSCNPVDPGILAGTKMPSDIWMNERLQAMGEKWKFRTVQNESVPASAPQSIPAQKEVSVGFSFYTDDMRPDNFIKED